MHHAKQRECIPVSICIYFLPSFFSRTVVVGVSMPASVSLYMLCFLGVCKRANQTWVSGADMFLMRCFFGIVQTRVNGVGESVNQDGCEVARICHLLNHSFCRVGIQAF